MGSKGHKTSPSAPEGAQGRADTPGGSVGRGDRLRLVVVGGLFVLAAGWALTVMMPHYVRSLWAPGPNTVGEAGKVWFARRAQMGEGLFLRGDDPPYYPSLHGALFHASVGWIGRAVGAEVRTLFHIGRAVSLLATGGALLLAGAMLRRLGARWAYLAVGAAVFLTARPIIQHTWSYRPDNWNLLIAVGTCSLLVFAGRSRLALTAAGLLPAAGFFIKAPGVSAIGAVVLVLLAQRRWLAAGCCAAVCVAAVGGTVGILEVATGGAYLAAKRSGMDVAMEPMMVARCLGGTQAAWAFLFLPALLAGRCRPRGDLADRTRATVWCFWAVSLVAYTLSAARMGSNSYYFLQAFVLGGVLVLDWLAERVRRVGGLGVAAAGLALLLIVQTAWDAATLSSRPTADVALAQTLRFAGDREQLARRLNALDGPVFTDDPGLNLLLDRPAILHPMFVATRIETGSLPIEAITGPVIRGEYAAVVLSGMTWRYRGVASVPPDFLRVVQQRYRPESARPGGYAVFLPARE